MRDRVAANEIVMRQGWLSHTPPSFQRAVIDCCILKSYPAGRTIYMVGDPPGGMFGLVSGHLGISIAPGERGPQVVHFALPGAWFGEAAVITGQTRRVGLAATRDAEVLHLPAHAIHAIAQQDPAVWRMIALVSLDHLDVARGAADDLMIRDHRKRFIAVLLRLGGCRMATPATGNAIEIDVSQEDLAAMANVARTTAGALLRAFEQDGYLKSLYRCVQILEPDAMRAMLLQRRM